MSGVEMAEIEVHLDDGLYKAVHHLASQCALTADQMASALVVLAFSRTHAAADQGEPIGWITDESLRRLQRGGNDSRGSVPIHSKRSAAAKHPLFGAAA